jgi:1-acyl-sn-glycerol-3-phosphate acyltransferase
MKYLRSAWIWFATASLILFWVPLMGVVWLFDRDPLKRRTEFSFRVLGRIVARVHRWRLHFRGLENLDPNRVFVVVSNHQSLADIPLIANLDVSAKWLAKVELFRVPVFGWMMRLARHIPVERSERRKAAHALLQCARTLRQGSSVLFFPEGTRSPGGELLPFNDGPFQIAIREKVAVLPLVVEGSGAALPRGTWLFGHHQDIHLTVLPPVDSSGTDVATLRELVRQQISDTMHQIRGTC